MKVHKLEEILNKLCWLAIGMLSLLVCSCTSDSTQMKVVFSDDPALVRKDSSFIYNGMPFSGIVKQNDSLDYTTFEISVKDGYYHGLFKEVYNNKQLRSRLFYDDGLLEGLQEGWHKNGQLSYTYIAKKGRPEGTYLEYYPSGQLQIEKFYEGGKVIKTKIIDINGRVLANFVLKNGRVYGPMGSSNCVSVIDESKLTN